jgi:manganese efflux pump family protein
LNVAELLVVGVVIGTNNLAVALALGALGESRRRWRIAATFGFFEFTIPLVGLLIGAATAQPLAEAGRWIAAALLASLGALAVRAVSRQPAGEVQLAARVTTWRGMAGLAAGLSLDNLVIGFALGLGEVSPLLLAAVIAAFSVSFTLLGLEIGRLGRRRWEAPAAAGSGALLIALAAAVAIGWVA